MRRYLLWIGATLLALTASPSGWADSPVSPVTDPSPVKEEEVASESDSLKYRVDLSKLESPEWKETIDRITVTPGFKAGHSSATVLRVILEGAEPLISADAAPSEGPTVNGVKIRITGPGGTSVSIDLGEDQPAVSPPSMRGRVPISAQSIKLNSLDMFPGGGGMFRDLNSGDFLIVEHINSSRRRGGKDPVDIKTTTHGQIKLWIPVPARGELGVYGDVILPKIDPSLLGRIVADVRSPEGIQPRPEMLSVGLVTVGGVYGDGFKMNADHVATSGLLGPGVYPVLLPTAETAGTPTNRWHIRVEPGSITYLTFFDRGEGPIELQSTQTIRPDKTDEEKTAVLRKFLSE
jgi:hypothetical protein